MATPIEMNVIMGQLTAPCYQSEQQRANGFAQALQVTFPLFSAIFNFGPNSPDVDQQQAPWFRTNSDGTPDKWYVFNNGFWLSYNFRQQGGESIFYNDPLSSLATFDGGEGSYNVNTDGTITPTIPITSVTGPMWQVDTTMQGCVALGVSNTALIIKDAYGNTINQWPQGSNSGEIQHTQLATEVGVHEHGIPGSKAYVDGGGGSMGPVTYTYTGGNIISANGDTDFAGGDTINNVDNTPVGFNVLNPYRAGYWIQRTARQYYRISA